MAEKGSCRAGVVVVARGRRAFEVSPVGQVSTSAQFARQRLPLPLSPAQVERAAADPPKRMGAFELHKYIAS
jgi:hypothetical protein